MTEFLEEIKHLRHLDLICEFLEDSNVLEGILDNPEIHLCLGIGVFFDDTDNRLRRRIIKGLT